MAAYGSYRRMSFKSQKPCLDAETLKSAQEAFDLAWAELSCRAVGCDGQTARNVIIRRIIKAIVETGERDPARLASYALRAFKDFKRP